MQHRVPDMTCTCSALTHVVIRLDGCFRCDVSKAQSVSAGNVAGVKVINLGEYNYQVSGRADGFRQGRFSDNQEDSLRSLFERTASMAYARRGVAVLFNELLKVVKKSAFLVGLGKGRDLSMFPASCFLIEARLETLAIQARSSSDDVVHTRCVSYNLVQLMHQPQLVIHKE